MDISFVILTWNSQKDIEKCVNSINKICTADSLEYKIFIVDNGSSESMVNQLKELEKNEHIFCIYLEKNYGTTYPRNLALKKITTEYVCVLDSDTEIREGSIKSLLTTFRSNEKIGIIAPQLILEDGVVQHSVKKFPTFSEKILKLKKIFGIGNYHKTDFYEDFPFTEIKEVDTAISAAWFFPRTILDEVGFLDEKIFYAPEDLDYSLRVWEKGRKIVYYPFLGILHKTQQISHHKPFSKVSRNHLKGLIYFYYKHGYWFSRRKIYKKLGMKPT